MDFNPMDSLNLFHMYSHVTYWFAVLCDLYSVLHIAMLHVWYHCATIRLYTALHSHYQLRWRMWRNISVDFFCSSFTFKPLTFSTSEVYASRVGDGICDCCDGSDEDVTYVTYDHEWERPTAIDCLCASTAFVHRLPFVCYFDLFCAHISHISLDPPGPSGHSRKVQQHLQGRRQNRAKHGDTMWHNVTQCDICWTKLAYYCALQRGSVLPTSMGSDFRQSRTG